LLSAFNFLHGRVHFESRDDFTKSRIVFETLFACLSRGLRQAFLTDFALFPVPENPLDRALLKKKAEKMKDVLEKNRTHVLPLFPVFSRYCPSKRSRLISVCSFGAQAGYWFFIDSKLYPYVLFPLEYTQSKTERKSGDDTSNRDSSGMSLTPEIGLTYFISKEAALGFGLYYEWASLKRGYEPYEGEKQDTKLVRSGGGLKAGLSLFF
jgi:hypothetical protein